MCYSAQVEASLKKLQRKYQSNIDFASFEALFGQRLSDDRVKISKALELNFESPQTASEKRIKSLIDEYHAMREKELQQAIFTQKKRLADAERQLQVKETKKALNDKRIATNKIEADVIRIRDLQRTHAEDRDSRIFPFTYAPIIVNEGDGPKIIAARYHCRPAGKPSNYDKRYDGLYSARRDSLQNFWKDQFAQHRAIVLINSFWENVKLHNYEHRVLAAGEPEKNLVLHFNPQPAMEMSIACVWSRWSAPGEADLASFAVITDEPLPEIAAAGHDRVAITLKDANAMSWLAPQTNVDVLNGILDDRERPHYEHRLAA